MVQKITLLLLILISCHNNGNKGSDIKQELNEKLQKTTQIDKCDIQKVAELKRQLPSNTNYEIIKEFLMTISVKCKNNAEFTQFSNEILFKTLKVDPTNFLKVLENENIEKDEVYRMITTPISDNINLDEILKNIMALNIKSVEKTNTIKSLKKALNKYN